MISFDNLSIVIQGPILPDFKKNLINIRKNFPNSEIIVSTWEGEGFNLDDTKDNNIKILFNKDIGGIVYENTKRINNVNRLILSTREGVKSASRQYVMKLRTDMLVTSSSIISAYNYLVNKYNKKNDFTFFKEKILVWEYYTRNLYGKYPYPYHISDIFYLGLKEDILKLFDIPYMTWKENNFYLNKRPNIDLYPNAINKYTPEQFIIVSFLKKHTNLNIKFEYQWDLSNNNDMIYEKILASNFIVIDILKYGIIFNKYKLGLYDFINILSHKEWEHLYHKYLEDKNNFNLLALIKKILKVVL